MKKFIINIIKWKLRLASIITLTIFSILFVTVFIVTSVFSKKASDWWDVKIAKWKHKLGVLRQNLKDNHGTH
jgi:hypothetical protein